MPELPPDATADVPVAAADGTDGVPADADADHAALALRALNIVTCAVDARVADENARFPHKRSALWPTWHAVVDELRRERAGVADMEEPDWNLSLQDCVRKDWPLLAAAADLTRHLGGARATCCKARRGAGRRRRARARLRRAALSARASVRRKEFECVPSSRRARPAIRASLPCLIRPAVW